MIKFIGPTCHAMGTHSLNDYFGAVKKTYNLQPFLFPMLKLLGLQSFSQLSGLYEQKYPISYPALNIAPCGTRKVIPRVRQRLRLLVLADTADKRVAEVVGQGPDEGLGGWLRVCMFF